MLGMALAVGVLGLALAALTVPRLAALLALLGTPPVLCAAHARDPPAPPPLPPTRPTTDPPSSAPRPVPGSAPPTPGARAPDTPASHDAPTLYPPPSCDAAAGAAGAPAPSPPPPTAVPLAAVRTTSLGLARIAHVPHDHYTPHAVHRTLLCYVGAFGRWWRCPLGDTHAPPVPLGTPASVDAAPPAAAASGLPPLATMPINMNSEAPASTDTESKSGTHKGKP